MEADVFLFLISPDSAKSKICGQEIDVAVKNGKRIIPIVVREIEWADTPPQLGHLNYIFFSRDDDFDTALKKLLTAIQTDYEWAATHRRLQVKALEWERNHKENSFLLRGKDLQDAELQLATNTSKEPHPTDLQREYAFDSRKAADRQRRVVTGISIVAAIALAALAVFGFYQARVARAAEADAKRQATISRSGELAAQAELLRAGNLQNALLLGVESYRMFDNPRTRGALLNVTNFSPHLLQFLAGYTKPVTGIAFSPDGRILASTGNDDAIILRDTATYQPLGEPLTVENFGAYCIAFSPDGKTLASGNFDYTIILLDVTTQQLIGQTPTGHTSDVKSVTFSPEGKILASSSWDNTIILWDVATLQPIGQPIMGSVVTFSPDGKTLASDSNDNTIILWDVATRQPIGQPLTGLNHYVDSLAFSPDGKILASGIGGDGVILWDVATQQAISEPLKAPSHVVNSVAFSPDGKTLASGGEDQTILLWDVETRQLIGQPFTGHTNYIYSVAFTARMAKLSPLVARMVLSFCGMWLPTSPLVSH